MVPNITKKILLFTIWPFFIVIYYLAIFINNPPNLDTYPKWILPPTLPCQHVDP